MLVAQGHQVADYVWEPRVCEPQAHTCQGLRLGYSKFYLVLKIRFWPCGYLVNFLLTE